MDTGVVINQFLSGTAYASAGHRLSNDYFGGQDSYKTIHVLQHVPVTGKKLKPQRACIVCKQAGTRRESRFCCLGCPGEPGFCRTEACFVIYHKTFGLPFHTHNVI